MEQEPQPQPPTPEATAAFRSYEEAQQKREITESRCLLGFVVWKRRAS